MNGVIKTKLATLETVVEIFKADCHKTTLMPISKKPIYIDPMSPSIDGTTKESVKYMIKKIMGELNKNIRNKLVKGSFLFLVLKSQNNDHITVLKSI